jgi:protein-S-isoprenylcysteine O-methyltransferase Ste14
MNTEYIILICIYLMTLIMRTSYELLNKAGKVNLKRKIIFMVVLIIMCLMWISWFGLCPLDPFRFSLPKIIHWTGIGIFIIGLALAIGAFIQLRGLENINHLVTTGLFFKVRHPMYIGFILWILGWAIYHGAVVSLMVGFIGIGNIIFWRRIEEENLKSLNGKTYQEYVKETWC